jgi:hypothetical protein
MRGRNTLLLGGAGVDLVMDLDDVLGPCRLDVAQDRDDLRLAQPVGKPDHIGLVVPAHQRRGAEGRDREQDLIGR